MHHIALMNPSLAAMRVSTVTSRLRDSGALSPASLAYFEPRIPPAAPLLLALRREQARDRLRLARKRIKRRASCGGVRRSFICDRFAPAHRSGRLPVAPAVGAIMVSAAFLSIAPNASVRTGSSRRRHLDSRDRAHGGVV